MHLLRTAFLLVFMVALVWGSGPDDRKPTDPQSVTSLSNPSMKSVAIEDLYAIPHVDRGSWSPDGKWIAFESDVTGRNNIWKMHADGSSKLKQRDATRIAAWRWQSGKSANPGGVPKHDVAKEIAKAIFLNNSEMIYKAYCKMLKRGNAYAFQVLSDRAFGKLKEHYEVEAGPFRDLTDDELRERIAKLEEQLGVLPEHIEPKDHEKLN